MFARKDRDKIMAEQAELAATEHIAAMMLSAMSQQSGRLMEKCQREGKPERAAYYKAEMLTLRALLSSI